MERPIRFSTSLFLSLFLAFPHSYAGSVDLPSCAQISSLTGTVEVANSTDGAWHNAAVGEKVIPSSRLRTGPFSGCWLETPEGHRLIVHADSRITFASLGEQTELQLEEGVLSSKVAKLKDREGYSVRTPTAVAAVRGTQFDVLVTGSGVTELRVFEGVVNFQDLKRLGPAVDVPRFQRSVVQPNAPAKPPEPLPKDLQRGADFVTGAKDDSSHKKPAGPNPPGGGDSGGFFYTQRYGNGGFSQFTSGLTSSGSSSPVGSANPFPTSGGEGSGSSGTTVSGDNNADPTLGLTLSALYATVRSANLNNLLTNTNVTSLFQEGLVQIAPDGTLRLAATGIGQTANNAITYFNASKIAGKSDLSYEDVVMTFNANIPSDYTQATSQALRSLNGASSSPGFYLTSLSTERGHSVDNDHFDKIDVTASGGSTAYNSTLKEWLTTFSNNEGTITPANGSKVVLYNKTTSGGSDKARSNGSSNSSTTYLGGAAPTITVTSVAGGYAVKNVYADGTTLTQTVTHFDSSGNTISPSSVPTGTSSLTYLTGAYAIDSISCSRFASGTIDNVSTMNARILGGIDAIASNSEASSVLGGNAPPAGMPTGVLTAAP